MLTYFIALFWALITPAINHTTATTCNHQVTVMDGPTDDPDTGGETGTIPPKP